VTIKIGPSLPLEGDKVRGIAVVDHHYQNMMHDMIAGDDLTQLSVSNRVA
jgi:hypothetical protein